MKNTLHNFLKKTDKTIALQSSKKFFSSCDLKADFLFEDLEVMAYLLNYEVHSAEVGLRLIQEEKLMLSYHLEKQIPYILTQMEKAGILVSVSALKSLKEEFSAKLKEITGEIWQMAGEEFNIHSPKQVNDVLFNKMGLKGGKKTSGGELSTKLSVLEELAADGVKIAEKLIETRHLAKLLHTYVEVLIQKAQSSIDSRIHTTFSSTETITGRLNSKNPNLQNLPIKTEIGQKIRQAFRAKEGKTLISFDYSQIELRVLAHIADVAGLKEAFLNEEDVHIKTASTMFEIPIESVTKELRNNAKAINFGIIYGLSAFALGKTLGVSTGKASDYIKEYFSKYNGIQSYMKEAEENAKKHGYVRTIFGKKCYLEGVNSSNYTIRSHALRSAINAGIQGSAADLIKKAMVELHDTINDDCKLILQIHDELVFEIKDELIQEICPKIVKIMEQSTRLSVPISVNCKNFI